MSFASFRALHRGDRIVFLPNAWDAATAALFAAAGAQAVATTSAALAWSCGYPDGGDLPRAELLRAVGAVCRAAGGKPVSADIEAGYSDEPETVAELVLALHALGVAGVNLEDQARAPGLLAAKIAASKRAVRSAGGDIFVNARADVYLRGIAEGDVAIRESIERAAIYEQAGADGFYPIGLSEPRAIAAIAKSTPLPLNVLADRSLPPPAQLYGLGVRRVSAGPYLAEMAYGSARFAAAAFALDGDCAALFTARDAGFDEMNALFVRSNDAD